MAPNPVAWPCCTAVATDVACDGTDGDDEDNTTSSNHLSCTAKRDLEWENSMVSL